MYVHIGIYIWYIYVYIYCLLPWQVTATDVRLLQDTTQLCRILLDMGGGVRACDLCDPYIVVLLADGSVALLQLVENELEEEEGREEGEGEEGKQEAQLHLSWPEVKVGVHVHVRI